MYSNEAGLVIVSGEVPNPGKDTIFGKAGTQMNFFSDAALAECEDIASPKRKEYDRWHEKLAKPGPSPHSQDQTSHGLELYQRS